jgi:hypothetical protein
LLGAEGERANVQFLDVVDPADAEAVGRGEDE